MLSLYMANRPSALAANIADPTDFQVVEQRQYSLGQLQPNPANPMNPPACQMNPGAGPDPTRNALWLPWIPGKVSYVAANVNVPILTGEMSGCWLVLFRMRGALCFGHIGTEDNENSSNSAQAKNAWKIGVNRGIVHPVKAYKPRALTPGADKVFGALSIHHNFYTLELKRDMNTYQVMANGRKHRDGNVPNLT
jgi:hypothetical protein